MRETIDEATSEIIQEKLAPIIAQHGLNLTLLAMADRITGDADGVLKRHRRSSITERLSVELDCLAGALRKAVGRYGGQ
jgi:hypothetical protein